jgi:hypothetical protein
MLQLREAEVSRQNRIHTFLKVASLETDVSQVLQFDGKSLERTGATRDHLDSVAWRDEERNFTVIGAVAFELELPVGEDRK